MEHNDILFDHTGTGEMICICDHCECETPHFAWFLQAVSPSYAVISVGNDNPYGHPHKDTLERLEAIGATILRTDEMGTIVIKSDGESITDP